MDYAGSNRSMLDRMIGAAFLNISTYEEVEHDTTATGQAATVVVLAAIAAAVGSLGHGGRGIVATLVGSLVGWALWAGVTWLIGTKLFNGTATWGELLRTLGFAQSPAILLVFAVIPLLGWLVALIVGLWVAAAGFIAVRQALDISTGQTLVTVIIGWVIMMLVGAAGMMF